MVLRRFRRDEEGNVTIMLGLALVPIMVALGSAVDYSKAANARTELQSWADAGVMAAALMDGDPSNEARTATARTFFPNLNAGLTTNASMTGTTVSLSVASDIVTVTANADIKTSLLSVAGIAKVPVRVRSSANRANNGPPVCVLALNTTADDAILFSGNSSFSANKCAVYSNSSSDSAISLNGSATVNTGGLCAVGGVSDGVGVTPMPKSHCKSAQDPFANIPVASSTGCTYTNVTVKPSNTATLNPGTYCNGLDIKGNATLQPGLYVIKNGELSITSQANVTGHGVTFYLTGNGAGFTINGGGVIDITAMTTGDYKGIAIVQDRASNVGASNTLNGNSDTSIQGAIYTPTQTLNVTGSGSFGQANPFMPMIADKLKFSGSSTVQSDLTAAETPAPLPKMSSVVLKS